MCIDSGRTIALNVANISDNYLYFSIISLAPTPIVTPNGFGDEPKALMSNSPLESVRGNTT